MVNDHTCGFCGRVFAEDEGQPTCGSCPLKGGCQLVRCPHCGYENPVAPPWLARVRAWFGTAAARSAGYDAQGDFIDDGAAVQEVACP
jgi:rubredoxin